MGREEKNRGTSLYSRVGYSYLEHSLVGPESSISDGKKVFLALEDLVELYSELAKSIVEMTVCWQDGGSPNASGRRRFAAI